MKPEVIRPRRRIPWRRVIAGLAIAWSGWCASRVLEGLERDRAATVPSGPACTSTVYYDDPYCPSNVWCEDGRKAWCRP